MKMTHALHYWQVDEVIECVDVTDATREALMHAAPGAYDGDGVPVADVWHKLDTMAQADIHYGLALLHGYRV